MQAGLMSQRLALRDIFTAGGLTRRLFVGTVKLTSPGQTRAGESEIRLPSLRSTL